MYSEGEQEGNNWAFTREGEILGTSSWIELSAFTRALYFKYLHFTWAFSFHATLYFYSTTFILTALVIRYFAWIKLTSYY